MRRCLRDVRGSFTLEASLVLPVIFYAILVLLFFCLYLYQNALLGQAASAAAERSAYTWDNSYRNDLTGAFEEGHYDSLYWRLKDDGMLQSIFGWGEANGAVRLRLPAGAASADSLAGKSWPGQEAGYPGISREKWNMTTACFCAKLKWQWNGSFHCRRWRAGWAIFPKPDLLTLMLSNLWNLFAPSSWRAIMGQSLRAKAETRWTGRRPETR